MARAASTSVATPVPPPSVACIYLQICHPSSQLVNGIICGLLSGPDLSELGVSVLLPCLESAHTRMHVGHHGVHDGQGPRAWGLRMDMMGLGALMRR